MAVRGVGTHFTLVTGCVYFVPGSQLQIGISSTLTTAVTERSKNEPVFCNQMLANRHNTSRAPTTVIDL